LSETQNSIKNIVIDSDSSPFSLRNLTPGASYEIQLFTVYENKESAAYISANFTTLPNTPGRFIVWFRNETTLLVLWQPPYPPGVYSHYKVSIDPPDAIQSIMFIEKEGEPPGPAQAAFYGLIPGRAYNISVQTVSEEQVSLATTAQYRTVPLAPRNVTFDQRSLTKDAFKVFWLPPKGFSEFDRYQVTIGLRRQSPKIVDVNSANEALFNTGLEPGHSYTVVVKTVSGNVASWPATGNVTTRPLPVENLRAKPSEAGPAQITWDVNENSIQDSFRVTYQTLPADGLPPRRGQQEEAVDGDTGEGKEGFNSGADSSSRIVNEPFFTLEEMLPGRNYSVSVRAVSNGIESEERAIYQATRE
jgi:cadherin 5 type 2 (VE-cadherin)